MKCSSREKEEKEKETKSKKKSTRCHDNGIALRYFSYDSYDY